MNAKARRRRKQQLSHTKDKLKASTNRAKREAKFLDYRREGKNSHFISYYLREPPGAKVRVFISYYLREPPGNQPNFFFVKLRKTDLANFSRFAYKLYWKPPSAPGTRANNTGVANFISVPFARISKNP